MQVLGCIFLQILLKLCSLKFNYCTFVHYNIALEIGIVNRFEHFFGEKGYIQYGYEESVAYIFSGFESIRL